MKRTGFYLGILFTLILSLGFFTISSNIVLGQNDSSSSSGSISCVPQFTTCGCMTVCAPEGGFVVGECFDPSCTAMLDPTSVNCQVVNGHCVNTLVSQTPVCTPQFSTCSCMAVCVREGFIGGECFNPSCDGSNFDPSSIQCNFINGECVGTTVVSSSSSSGQIVCQPKFANCSCMTICAKSNEIVGVCFNPTCTDTIDPTSVLCELVGDNCVDVITVANPGNVSLSQNFNGVWKGRVLISSSSSGGSSSGNCVVCPELEPECAPGEVFLPHTCESCGRCEGLGLLPVDPITGNMCIICADDIVIDCAESGLINVPQSCTECQHCEQPTSSSSSGGLLAHVTEGSKKPKVITLKLCVRNGAIEGTIQQALSFINAGIESQTIISENEVRVTAKDREERTATFTLKLTGDNKMNVTFEDGDVFETKKNGTPRNCLVPKPSMSGPGMSEGHSMSGMGMGP